MGLPIFPNGSTRFLSSHVDSRLIQHDDTDDTAFHASHNFAFGSELLEEDKSSVVATDANAPRRRLWPSGRQARAERVRNQ